MFLGHVVSKVGMSTDPEKIQVVRDGPPQLRHMLCVVSCSYCRRFARGFANIAAPLHRKKDKAFSWTKECDDAFNRLKHVLSQAPVLANPTSEGTFVLDTDDSNTGIGAVQYVYIFSLCIKCVTFFILTLAPASISRFY